MPFASRSHPSLARLSLVACVWAIACVAPREPARAESMLQYFNTSWAEITAKMPELAEAGYTSLWLPPPTKGSGGLSVGYDLWDPFDLGSKDQRGSVRTRYGTEAELLRLVETAHRFGIRVYFDNIMNHRAFDVPGFNENTAIDIYPGLVPEDFHLRVTQEGFYRKWDNTRSWGDTWQVQNLGLADLIDIAQEPGTTNNNFGASEGSTGLKIELVRDPANPGRYCYIPGSPGQKHAYDQGTYVGFGPNNGITANMISTNATFYSEYVEDYLHRAARWLMDRTRADGLRLDAVKHVRADFFGAQGIGADASNYGYSGKVQLQFNLSRGFDDWDNHRNSTFNTEIPRDDALLFGEHLGEPPGYGDYINRGMRLVDNPLRQQFNDRLGSPWNGLQGFDQPGAGGFTPDTGVMHAQSHDSDYAARRELQHAMYFTRAGIGLLYTDGNYQAETLGESGGAFPRHANTAFLGQWGDGRVPNLLYLHEHFARGVQRGVWSDEDLVAYLRKDDRQGGGSNEAVTTTLLFLLNDNYASGRKINDKPGSANATVGFSAGDYLYNYSWYGGGFYKYGSELKEVVVPPGGYFAFAPKNPDPSDLWSPGGGRAVTILQNGAETGSVGVERRDGPNGDPNFNPYNLPNRGYGVGETPKPYTYKQSVPRVTNGTAIRFVARADGSAENMLFRLDGGVDLNGVNHAGGDPRDNPPKVSTDLFLGYEQPTFVQRIYPELFAAVDTGNRNVTGSAGAETYTTGGLLNAGAGSKLIDGDTVAFVFHNPAAAVEGVAPARNQFDASENRLWSKTNAGLGGFRVFAYYTGNGTYPEGAGGAGIGTTRAVELKFSHDAGGGSWWKSDPLPGDFTGSSRYKIGAFKGDFNANDAVPYGSPAFSWYPGSATAVAKKREMLTTFQTSNRNLTAVTVRPHNDYGDSQTGLSEGMHVFRARAFLNRSGQASIYNTFTHPFYYDLQTPAGEIRFPQNDGETVGGSQYGVVVRTDPSVTEVWFQFLDDDAANDDASTQGQNGNGGGPEPFTDTNANGARDGSESFEDLDGDGIWDAALPATWARATEVTPSTSILPGNASFTKEWRFNYVNIPATGNATLRARLFELSSTRNVSLSDPAAHTTTLERTVNTAGPDYRMFIAYPSTDGDLVGPGYLMKVYFTKALANGLTEPELLQKFTVLVGSNEANAAGTPISRTGWDINYDIPAGFHELAVPLPNLYNDVSDYLHKIEVILDRSPDPSLTASRLARAYPSAVPRVTISSPPELDSDGKPYVIELPDLAAPQPEDRRFLIRVTTSTNVNALNLTFTFGSGNIALAAEGVTALTGNVATTNGSTAVTGNGTAFADELSPGNVIRINGVNYGVAAVGSNTSFTLSTPAGGAFTGNASRTDPNPHVEGTTKFWDFEWTGIAEGSYRLLATVTDPSTHPDPQPSDSRNITVVFREITVSNDSDADDDDDGLWDVDEATPQPLPNGRDGTDPNRPVKPNPETWTNGDVHIYYAFGRSQPLMPDTDGDGLPDGVEVGWRTATSPPTNATADTDGDGYTNFRTDLDPPFYNTLDNNGAGMPRTTSASQGGDRAQKVWGATTNPNNPDSDGDGLSDGIEDKNRNGWLDGDGLSINATASPVTVRGSADNSNWPDGIRQPGETWTETDPNNPDTDSDGATDGHGEDRNYNGVIDGDTNNNRVYDAGEAWTETDPLKADTDGDGLLDGWEIRYGLDPLDDGTDKLSTATPNDGDAAQGASGDPDGDGVTNAQEQSNGTDPKKDDTLPPPPPGSITIGPGAPTTAGEVTNLHEFTDWSLDDLIVLDEYDGDGVNNQGTDLYRAWDGFDSSRDMVAFYAQDGGVDGIVYFRLDFQDLKALAEEGNLDIYVVIDTGNPAIGESALPDDVDTRTDMKWEAVVAVYQSNIGAVYVDTNSANNTTTIGENLTAKGVVRRDQNTPNGFKKAYYSSALDAVEFSISRQALIDAGWTGNFSALNFQVFTTKDGTQNSPRGLGDIAGRSDIRDTIYDDNLASDYWRDQSTISGVGSVLKAWFSRRAGQSAGQGTNDRGRQAKVVSLIHEHRAVLPATATHALINNGAGAGFYRPVDAHQAYTVPMALHLTPTLAASFEWAGVDPLANKTYLDGPALNDRLALLSGNGVVDLLGSTFAEHLPLYFPDAFNADNVDLAASFLNSFYGSEPSDTVFYPPERVLSDETLDRIGSMGFTHTLADQMRHVFKWFGRTSALGNDGYSINRVNGMDLFVVSDQASTFRFATNDGGLNLPLRELLSRKARNGKQDQSVILFSDWSDFGNKTQADAYDINLRWMASRPWIRITTPQEIAAGQVPYRGSDNNTYTTWSTVNRGTGLDKPVVAKDWIDHATQETYDHWYFGQPGREEGLEPKVFSIRSGAPVPQKFGTVGVDGVADAAWDTVGLIGGGRQDLLDLARSTAHSAVALTAFHNQTNNDLSKFSTGTYINPDTTSQTLANFTKAQQSQFRFAALYARVADWADDAQSGVLAGLSQTASEDVDLDGEPEYLLYNDRVFALFERMGGRLVHAWVRDLATGSVLQMIGNPVAFSNSDTEAEGDSNANGSPAAINAHRTSAFKDWYATGSNTSQYVNDLFNPPAAGPGTGWVFTSSDGRVAKTITLAPNANALRASYVLNGPITGLYLRFGLSPNLMDLLRFGQGRLGSLLTNGSEVNLFNNAPGSASRVYLRFAGPGLGGASYNAVAIDDAPGSGFTSEAINMRNQAQTQQVELFGNSGMTFLLGFETGPTLSYDTDTDGMPDAWETAAGLNPNVGTGNDGPTGDPDKDGRTNLDEYVFGRNPNLPDLYFPSVTPIPAGYTVSFPTIPNRLYRVFYSDTLAGGSWQAASSDLVGDGAVKIWTDNGTGTSPHPQAVPRRFYKVEVRVP